MSLCGEEFLQLSEFLPFTDCIALVSLSRSTTALMSRRIECQLRKLAQVLSYYQ